MQKKLIALAVAGLASTAAFAQSNVTLYGMADGYVSNFRGDSNTRVTGMNTGGLAPSRLGFKGSEDLGNGLKAIFTLEYAVNLDTQGGVGSPAAPGAGAQASDKSTSTNGLSYTRQSFVGLSSNAGTVVGGVLQTPSFDWAVKYNVVGGSSVIDPYNVLAKAAANNKVGVAFTGNNSSRFGNAVAYVSPSFSGVTLKAARVIGEQATSDVRFDVTSLAADYDNGPLSVGVYYNNVNTTAGLADYGVGATYDFGVAKLFAAFAQAKNANSGLAGNGTYNLAGSSGLTFGQASTNQTDRLYSIGASVPVTKAGSVKVSYAKLNRSSDSTGMTLVNSSDVVKGILADANMWTLAYTHDLSKRTTAYAGYTRLSNSGDGQLALGGVTVDKGSSSNGIFAGLNHKF